jgi:type IV pilus assembly protein PilW
MGILRNDRMKFNKKEKSNTQGFTLVELLVAMAVSLLAIGAIYSTFLNQFKSYQIQEEIAAMQQNIRAAMYHMQREIRMAGCDPYNNSTTLPSDDPIPESKHGTTDYPIKQIIEANSTSIVFMEDVNPPDGYVTGTNEIIGYSLSDNNLVRNTGGGNQAVAENIDALDFVYLDGASPPVVLNLNGTNVSSGDLSRIRSVEITIVARTGRSLRASPNNMVYYNQQGSQIIGAQNDHYSRKWLTTVVKCRNLGLN